MREELGAVSHLPTYQAGLAALHYNTGNWDEALVATDTGITIGDEVGTPDRQAERARICWRRPTSTAPHQAPRDGPATVESIISLLAWLVCGPYLVRSAG